MSDGSAERDRSSDLESVERTPRDFVRVGPPSLAEANRRNGPPPPPGAILTRVSRSTPPDASEAPPPRAEGEAHAMQEPGTASTAVDDPTAHGARAAVAATSGSDDADIESSDDGDDDAASYSWSETSLYLEGTELADAVEKLHALYREELATRRIPDKSVASCLGGLRKRTNRSNWYQVQTEARQRLTGARLESWNNYEYQATHERRRRRHGRSRSPRPAA